MGSKTSQVKAPSRAQLIREFKQGKLLGTLFGRYSRSWGRDEKIVTVIADAHNDGDIDILSIVTDEAIEEHKGHVFFQGQTLYCSLIPKLNGRADALIRTVRILIQAAGNDGAAGFPANALASWCEVDPSRPHEMLTLVDAGYDGASSFLTPILRVGAMTDRKFFLDRAHGFALTGRVDEQRAAIRALGQIQPADETEWDRLTTTLAAIALMGDDMLGASTVEAATQRLCADICLRRAELESVVEATLDAAHGENVLHQCADALWLNGKHFSDALRSTMLDALLDLKPANKGTIDHLDHALAELIKKGGVADVSAFLEKLILRHKDAIKLKQFKSTRNALHEEQGHTLHDWMVNWFLKGDFDLCRQFSSAFFGVDVDGLVLDIDFSRYELKDSDYPYLARKAIGFLFLKPITAASFIVSLVRSAPRNILSELEDLLFDPMLLNYTGVDRKLLRGVSKDRKDKARAVVKQALDRATRYLDDLAAAREIKELHPSERQRQIERQRNADSMAEAHKKADQKSVFANLFTKVIVLHGNRSISYHQMGKEEPRRLETKMATHSVSFEIPRIEIADPGGLQQMLISCRLERRPV